MTNNSDSTGPWASSTLPSSGNSSPDRFPDRKPPRNAQGMDGYGHDGMGGAPIPEEYASDDSMGYPKPSRRAPNGYGAGPQQNMNGPAPAVQPPPRQTIQLGGGGDSTPTYTSQPGGALPSTARPEEEKKKSWIKRRFSKKD